MNSLFFNSSLKLAGSLIKLVYFSRHEDYSSNDKKKKTVKERLGSSNGNRRSYPILGGRLHFVKFETTKINECLDFIHSKQLHRAGIFIMIPFNVCWSVGSPICFMLFPFFFSFFEPLFFCFFFLSVNIPVLLWIGLDARWHTEAPANVNVVIKVILFSLFMKMWCLLLANCICTRLMLLLTS